MSLFRDHPHPHSFRTPCPPSVDKLYLEDLPPTSSFISPKRLGHRFLRPLSTAARATRHAPPLGGGAGLRARRLLGTALRYIDRHFTTGQVCFVAVNFRRGLSWKPHYLWWQLILTAEKWGRSGKVRRRRERKRVGGGREATNTCAVRCRTQFSPRESAAWFRSPATWGLSFGSSAPAFSFYLLCFLNQFTLTLVLFGLVSFE